MTLLTLLALTAFVLLGRWQWHRGEAKQAVWAEFEREVPAFDLGGRDLDGVSRFGRVRVNGQFEPEHQFLLDNRSHAGRPGYEVLTPFRLYDGRRLLVNRGWMPFTGYRDQLPDVTLAQTGPLTITGRVEELPIGGLASGRAPPDGTTTWPKLTSFPMHEDLERALGGQLQRRVLLLDPMFPVGFVRNWAPPGMPPTRHFSYAIQWWGFATVLLVIYFGLNFRKVS